MNALTVMRMLHGFDYGSPERDDSDHECHSHPVVARYLDTVIGEITMLSIPLALRDKTSLRGSQVKSKRLRGSMVSVL
jgi:hypothetical protein